MQTPGQVAKRAGVTAQTIRNYSQEYGELLSAGARGENGTRLYTDEDVEVLCSIAAMRKAGVPPGDIRSGLRATIPPVIDVAPSTPLNAPQNGAIQAYSDLQIVLLGHQSQIDELRRDLRATSDGRVTWLIIGFALAILLVAVVLWLE